MIGRVRTDDDRRGREIDDRLPLAPAASHDTGWGTAPSFHVATVAS